MLFLLLLLGGGTWGEEGATKTKTDTPTRHNMAIVDVCMHWRKNNRRARHSFKRENIN